MPVHSVAHAPPPAPPASFPLQHWVTLSSLAPPSPAKFCAGRRSSRWPWGPSAVCSWQRMRKLKGQEGNRLAKDHTGITDVVLTRPRQSVLGFIALKKEINEAFYEKDHVAGNHS
ncbi:protein FAM162A isoform X5 [Macaca fascicularis]|uniref:protein FAM162A isoform X5 n=1 Tax=Macaca fascicularis TaxID=9541 RepID=UPI003D158D4E